jgi:hypothetical protein
MATYDVGEAALLTVGMRMEKEVARRITTRPQARILLLRLFIC